MADRSPSAQVDRRGLRAVQEPTCRRVRARWIESRPEASVGVLGTLGFGDLALHGLRCEPSEGVSGWYLWSGAERPRPGGGMRKLPVSQVLRLCPQAAPFLGLPPGWRFLLAPGSDEAWEDPRVFED